MSIQVKNELIFGSLLVSDANFQVDRSCWVLLEHSKGQHEAHFETVALADDVACLICSSSLSERVFDPVMRVFIDPDVLVLAPSGLPNTVLYLQCL